MGRGRGWARPGSGSKGRSRSSSRDRGRTDNRRTGNIRGRLTRIRRSDVGLIAGSGRVGRSLGGGRGGGGGRSIRRTLEGGGGIGRRRSNASRDRASSIGTGGRRNRRGCRRCSCRRDSRTRSRLRVHCEDKGCRDDSSARVEQWNERRQQQRKRQNGHSHTCRRCECGRRGDGSGMEDSEWEAHNG